MTNTASPDRRRSRIAAKLVFLVVAAVAIVAGCAKGGTALSGHSSTENRQPGAFSSVSVASSIALHVRIGSPASVAVTTWGRTPSSPRCGMTA